MRVIAGSYKGRRLDSLEGMDIRPTSDRVKEALFSILGDVVIDSTFLDLFGGTGSIGIEAISRGAGSVVFIDESIKSIKVLRGNLEKLDIRENVEVYHTDYITALNKLYKNNRKFDLVFIDPPYSKGIAQNALAVIDREPIIQDGGIVIVEHDIRDPQPENVGRLHEYYSRLYGSTKLSFYTTAGERSQ